MLTLLLRSSEFDQLVKIPALVSHYLDHLNEDGKISFMQFIAMHYESNNGHSHQNNHKDLPFKSHDCQNFSQILLLEIHEPTILGLTPSFYNPTFAVYHNDYLMDKLASIWQPPQLSA
ncbi:MAG: hypothetical protein IT245_08210 [Bacteroidia bacterium]|nr:hypothetical protein [Bacteroidia bacterium]